LQKIWIKMQFKHFYNRKSLSRCILPLIIMATMPTDEGYIVVN
jgi:hypothetical protein